MSHEGVQGKGAPPHTGPSPQDAAGRRAPEREAVTCVLSHGGERGRGRRCLPVSVGAPAGVAAQHGQGFQGLDSAGEGDGAGMGGWQAHRLSPATGTGWWNPSPKWARLHHQHRMGWRPQWGARPVCPGEHSNRTQRTHPRGTWAGEGHPQAAPGSRASRRPAAVRAW